MQLPLGFRSQARPIPPAGHRSRTAPPPATPYRDQAHAPRAISASPAGIGIGDAAERQAAGPGGAIQDRPIRIDGNETAIRRERRAAELQGEIERLAQQQHHVGAFGDVGIGAQAGVVEAARSFAEAGRDGQRRLDPAQQIAAFRGRQHRGADHQRPLRRRQQRQHRIRRRIAQRHRRRGEIRIVRPGHRVFQHSRVQHVGRQAEMHRSGAARRGQADRLRHIHPDRRGVRRHPGGLADRRGHLDLPQFLEAAAAELVGLGMAGQQHHRGFLPQRGEQRADRVGVARAAGDPGDAGPSGQTSIRVRHVHRRGFMPHMHQRSAWCRSRHRTAT